MFEKPGMRDPDEARGHKIHLWSCVIWVRNKTTSHEWGLPQWQRRKLNLGVRREVGRRDRDVGERSQEEEIRRSERECWKERQQTRWKNKEVQLLQCSPVTVRRLCVCACMHTDTSDESVCVSWARLMPSCDLQWGIKTCVGRESTSGQLARAHHFSEIVMVVGVQPLWQNTKKSRAAVGGWGGGCNWRSVTFENNTSRRGRLRNTDKKMCSCTSSVKHIDIPFLGKT